MVHLRPSGTESGKLVRSFSIWNIWRQEKMLLRLFDLYLLQGKHFIRRQHRDLQMQVPPNNVQSRRNILKSRGECINMEGIISPPSWDRVTWSVKIWLGALPPPPSPPAPRFRQPWRPWTSSVFLLLKVFCYKHFHCFVLFFHFTDEREYQSMKSKLLV